MHLWIISIGSRTRKVHPPLIFLSSKWLSIHWSWFPSELVQGLGAEAWCYRGSLPSFRASSCPCWCWENKSNPWPLLCGVSQNSMLMIFSFTSPLWTDQVMLLKFFLGICMRKNRLQFNSRQTEWLCVLVLPESSDLPFLVLDGVALPQIESLYSLEVS